MLDNLFDILILAQESAPAVPVEEATEVAKQTVEKLTEAAQSPSMANLGYLIAAVFFILGIKGMTHPRTAVRGNQLGACGMLLAVVVVLVTGNIVSWPLAIIGMIVGSAGGVWLAQNVQMTQMPQLVALFNGFGGIASVLVAAAEVLKATNPGVAGLAAGLTGLIGSVTFTGSLIAAGKLQELPQFKKPWSFNGQQIANAALVVVSAYLAFEMTDGTGWEFWLLVPLALVLGIFLVTPIGGADMPVVIALLNSYSGLAAAAAGFCNQQQCSYHRRFVGRCFRLDSHQHHVQGDESFAGQRVVRQAGSLWRICRRRRSLCRQN